MLSQFKTKKEENVMAQSYAEFRNNLRKLDFPACAMEALPKIEFLIVNRGKQSYIMQLISEFIFLERLKEVDIRKIQSNQPYPTSQLNAIQEFQLIVVLINFFSQPGPEATRNAVFLSIFDSNSTPKRSKILCRMISTAVSGSVAPLLSSAGTWMQQVGCTTTPSLDVAQSLINDFITFSRKTSEQLRELPLVASHFAANFMTAAADLYLNDQRSGVLVPPPDMLLDVFTEWITENPTLCLASQQPLMLPAGAIAMPVVTPLAGLIRWTVLAPLVSNSATYSNLHLSILQTLQILINNPSTTALHVQDLIQIVSSLQKYAALISADNNVPEQDPAYQKCLERFAQAVQVALKSNCIFGNKPQLLCVLETLPAHALTRIVIAANKTT